VLLVASGAFARESTRQGAGGSFSSFSSLISPAGFRASGGTLAMDQASSLYLGPSAIRRAEGTALGMTYSQPYRDIDGFDVGSIDAVTAATPVINLGLSYGQVRVAGIREASGGALTGRTFDAALGAGRIVATPRSDGRFGWGAGLNLYSVDIRDVTEHKVGLDVGGDVTFDSARLLLNLRNFGIERDDPNRLPILGELVGEWAPYSQLRLGGAVTYEEDGYGDFRLGAAYDAFDLLTLVAGYTNDQRAWSAGVILRYGKMNLQYSLQQHHELETSHTVTLGVKF
jgi:hypothetical protein